LSEETWTVDATKQIKWTPTGTFNFVKLEYSTDGGTNWTQITGQTAAGTSGVESSYDWTVPDAIGTNVVVRVSDTAHLTTVRDSSNAAFNIMGALTVTAPNGGQTWYVGDTNRDISWNGSGTISNVKFDRIATEEGLIMHLPWTYNSANYTSTGAGGIDALQTNSSAQGYSAPTTFKLRFFEEDKNDNPRQGSSFNATTGWTSDKARVWIPRTS
jgi:hypothetical protein